VAVRVGAEGGWLSLKRHQHATIGPVGTVLVYLVVAVVAAAVMFLVASLIFGRGEELAALPPDATPTWLPDGPIMGDDVRAVRFAQVLRGYRMSEVDWVLQRAAAELDALRARVAELEARQ
jgi:DivIVA domain-containing protein